MEGNDIVEIGIDAIVVSRHLLPNKVLKPAGQRAKWFRDELGQVWCKFDLAPASHQQNVVTLVIPRERVVEVRYKKTRV